MKTFVKNVYKKNVINTLFSITVFINKLSIFINNITLVKKLKTTYKINLFLSFKHFNNSNHHNNIYI